MHLRTIYIVRACLLKSTKLWQVQYRLDLQCPSLNLCPTPSHITRAYFLFCSVECLALYVYYFWVNSCMYFSACSLLLALLWDSSLGYGKPFSARGQIVIFKTLWTVCGLPILYYMFIPLNNPLKCVKKNSSLEEFAEKGTGRIWARFHHLFAFVIYF